MSQTPPPLPDSAGKNPPTAHDLRQVASQQRAILLCVLGEIILFVPHYFAHQEGMDLLAGWLAIGVIAVNIVGAVFVFMLAIRLFGTAAGIVLGILAIIPCIGLIILLVVSQRATSVLRSRGIRVGLLGANPSSIRS